MLMVFHASVNDWTTKVGLFFCSCGEMILLWYLFLSYAQVNDAFHVSYLFLVKMGATIFDIDEEVWGLGWACLVFREIVSLIIGSYLAVSKMVDDSLWGHSYFIGLCEKVINHNIVCYFDIWRSFHLRLVLLQGIGIWRKNTLIEVIKAVIWFTY